MIKTKKKLYKTHKKRIKKYFKNKTRKIHKKHIKNTKKNRDKLFEKRGGSKEGEDYTGLQEDSASISTAVAIAPVTINPQELNVKYQIMFYNLVIHLKDRLIKIYKEQPDNISPEEDEEIQIYIYGIYLLIQESGIFSIGITKQFNELVVITPTGDNILPYYMEDIMPPSSKKVLRYDILKIDLLSAIYYFVPNDNIRIIITQIFYNINPRSIESFNVYSFVTPIGIAFEVGIKLRNKGINDFRLLKFLLNLFDKTRDNLEFKYLPGTYYPNPKAEENIVIVKGKYEIINECLKQFIQLNYTTDVDPAFARQIQLIRALPETYNKVLYGFRDIEGKFQEIITKYMGGQWGHTSINIRSLDKQQILSKTILGIVTPHGIDFDIEHFVEVLLSKQLLDKTDFWQQGEEEYQQMKKNIEKQMSSDNAPIVEPSSIKSQTMPAPAIAEPASIEPIVETKQKRKKKKKPKTKQGILLGENPEVEEDDQDEQDEVEQIVPQEEPVNEMPSAAIEPVTVPLQMPAAAIAQQHVVTELTPQSIAFWGHLDLDVNELKDTINSWMMASLQPEAEHICSKIIQKFKNYSLLNASELSQEDAMIYNIMSCAAFIIIGTVLDKFSKSQDYNRYDLIIKGGKGLQISFEEFVFKYNYESDDVDILLFDKSRQNNNAEMLMISSEICNLVKWVIESASVSSPLFSNISTKLAEPTANPRDKTKSRYVSKITYINGQTRKVISEIDIKNPEEVDKTEEYQLSQINFPLGINFYFPSYLIFNPFNFDSIHVAYIYQQIFEAFKEKTYIYTKYFLLKKIYIKIKGLSVAPQDFIDKDEDIRPCNYFLKKFKKSINAIFYYVYTRFCQTALADPSFKERPDYSNYDKQLQIYRQLNASLRALQDIDNLEKLKNSSSRLSPQQMGKIRSKPQVLQDIEKFKAEERPFYLYYSQHIFSQNLFPGFESINYHEFGSNLFMDVFDSIIN